MKASLYRDRIILDGYFTIPEGLSVHGIRTGVSSSKATRSFPLCGDILRRLIAANPDLVVDNQLKERLRDIKAQQVTLEDIKSKQDAYGDSRLDPYQRVAVAWFLAIKRGILADEQGLGKTVMASSACAQLLGKIRIGVICSKSNIPNWTRHLKEFFKPGKDLSAPQGHIIYHEDGSITHIVNYDNTNSLLGNFDVLIIDEAHNIRNRKTKMFTSAKRVAKRSEYLFLLTATPTVNADYDMWALLHLCDPARFSSYWSYVFRFFLVSDTGFGMKIESVKDSERENLLNMVSTYTLHRDTSLIDLPEMSKSVVSHILGDDHRKIYQEMEDKWVASLYDSSISASVKVAQITRLRQLAISPKLLFANYEGSDKIDTLIKIIRGRIDNIVVFTFFETAARVIKDRLDVRCEILSGSVSGRERDSMIQAFGIDFRVLIATHGTGGEGLNLTQSTCAIFLDLTWHPAGNQHAMKRIYRRGQEEDVEVIVIKSIDTVEDFIFDTIRRKGRMTVNDLIYRYKRDVE